MFCFTFIEILTGFSKKKIIKRRVYHNHSKMQELGLLLKCNREKEAISS